MLTITLSNQKGGTSKTTSTLALGALLAGAGLRVLMVDLDPQASLTQCLGIDAEGRSLAEVLGTTRPGRLQALDVVKPIRENLDLIPGDLALSMSESGLVTRYGREYVLRDALEPAGRHYDVCLIDSPPSLAVLTINALGASDGVIIPVIPSMMDVRGLAMFRATLEEIKPINRALKVIGVIVSQYDGRTITHQQTLAALERAGLRVLGTIPRSIRVQESAAARQPITDYDPGGKVTEAYENICKEVQAWLNDHNQATTK